MLSLLASNERLRTITNADTDQLSSSAEQEIEPSYPA